MHMGFGSSDADRSLASSVIEQSLERLKRLFACKVRPQSCGSQATVLGQGGKALKEAGGEAHLSQRWDCGRESAFLCCDLFWHAYICVSHGVCMLFTGLHTCYVLAVYPGLRPPTAHWATAARRQGCCSRASPRQARQGMQSLSQQTDAHKL